MPHYFSKSLKTIDGGGRYIKCSQLILKVILFYLTNSTLINSLISISTKKISKNIILFGLNGRNSDTFISWNQLKLLLIKLLKHLKSSHKPIIFRMTSECIINLRITSTWVISVLCSIIWRDIMKLLEEIHSKWSLDIPYQE